MLLIRDMGCDGYYVTKKENNHKKKVNKGALKTDSN